MIKKTLKLFVTLTIFVAHSYAFAANAYTSEFGVSKIIPATEVYPNFKQSDSIKNFSTDGKVYIVTTSTSDLKIKSTQQFISTDPAFKDMQITYYNINVQSGIAEQPVGLANGILGASNRIANAKQLQQFDTKSKTAIYFVAIENFVSNMPATGQPTDHALIIIEAPDAKQYMYLSDGVEICRDIYEIVITPGNFTIDKTGTKSTIGEYMEFAYRVSSSDWFGFVTESDFDRQKQIATAFNFARYNP